MSIAICIFMVKKKSNNSKAKQPGVNSSSQAGAPAVGWVKPASQAPVVTAAAAQRQLATPALPPEIGKGDWTTIILALMMFMAPALGVPHEEMLQDTLKSIVMAFGMLGAALLLFWQQRNRRDALRWHAVIWIPLAWMLYALGSMVWSHTYLAGVEAIRWFIFSGLVWLCLNTLSRERVGTLLLGIHCGAFVAALWAALQFWINFSYFPQGPNPASTFVNRNFIAEFLACTLAASFYLLLMARSSLSRLALSVTMAFNVMVILMTGTRSALFALAVSVPVLALIAWLYRRQFFALHWKKSQTAVVVVAFAVTVLGLGMLPTGNPKLLEEHRLEARGMTAIERSFARAKSAVQTQEYTAGSFSVRLVMWKATLNIIQKRPWSGVGAGAWEVDIPLYQAEGSQLETDYYVHNEILQLLAEYGVVGWLTLLALLAYLSVSAWRTLRLLGTPQEPEAPVRAIALATLLAFMVVSNAGFPWRLASTGVIFALMLGLLAASDARLAIQGWHAAGRLPWRPGLSQTAAVVTMLCLALAAFITQKAAESESKLVRAVKYSMGVSQSGDPNNPKFDKTKREILELVKQGTDINPHYRKVTPMVADEFAKWGDWSNATWIWETVISSRPYVVAILTNIARGYAQLGDSNKALNYLERAEKIQPKAPSVRSLKVVLWSRIGKEPEALALARSSLAEGIYDHDLVNAAHVLAVRAQDWSMALKALDLKAKNWPAFKADSLVKQGAIYLTMKDMPAALDKYRQALQAAGPKDQAAIWQQIPAPLHEQLK